MHFALVIVVSVLLFLVAAKSHGRQLRLERELEGHHHVVFGGRNHEWVEALWRRDRYRFWSLTLLFIMVLAVAVVASGKALPLLDPASDNAWATIAIAAVLWSPAVSFFVLGAASAWRLRVALTDRAKDGGGSLIGQARDDWARAATLGSLGWWGAGLLLAACVILSISS